jgi:hypothetical protein
VCYNISIFSDRVSFDENEKKILWELVVNSEGGKFVRVLRDKSSSKNFEKSDVWNSITERYVQVIEYLLLIFN